MLTPRRQKSFALCWAQRCLLAATLLVVLLISGLQVFLLINRFIKPSWLRGSALPIRTSLPDTAFDETPGQLVLQHPAMNDFGQHASKAAHIRINRWSVPSSTKTAAQKAADQAMGVKPKHSAGSTEQEFDDLVQSLRNSGRIGIQKRSPARRQRTVQDLPQLQVSSKLVHAAELGMHQASHGYQLTGGIKPKSKLGKEHLSMLSRMRGSTSSSSIWQ